MTQYFEMVCSRSWTDIATEHGQALALPISLPKNVLVGREKLLVHKSHVYRGESYLPGVELEPNICGRH